ncbi:hypothetical protein HDU79_011498 [Rhizoclosmatium sp. JEL0117]|nr:hypothetical protein HDU79_011498 [Rhizoclosmatium sp. JEL0117]
MERPLISREEPMWDMEDPDLMPTLNDWILCHRMMTDDGKTSPISGEYDAEAFLFEFYQLPPVLRLTRCAIAATYHLTQTEAFEYYRRARKAFSKAGSEPSVELIRAYIAVNGFAMNMLGQPLVGLQFLKLAVTMIRDIKLYIDPDDSPWLDYLNLTERQKEDRRRAFWQVYTYYVWHQTICNDSDYIEIELSCDRIKGPNPSFTMFRPNPTRKDYCAALGLIAKIKRLNSIPPPSITELVTSSSIVDFESQLISMQASVPDEMKLWAENPTTITAEEEAEFVKKSLATNDKLCSSNMVAQTAISLLYRPIMFLSSLKQLHPLLLSPTEQQIVSNSIYRCLSSALRISNLFSLARKHNAGPDPFEILDTTECLFECFVVIWFTICRMGSGWAGVVAPLIPDFGSLRAQLADIVEFMRENDSGYNSPTLVSIVAMLQEIDRVRSGQSSLNLSDEVSGLEVGMQVMSIGADFGDPAEEIVAPYAFLGLLGLDVDGGVRWKGRSEESWRLFWKLYK